jgi:hypothetical protein
MKQGRPRFDSLRRCFFWRILKEGTNQTRRKTKNKMANLPVHILSLGIYCYLILSLSYSTVFFDKFFNSNQ